MLRRRSLHPRSETAFPEADRILSGPEMKKESAPPVTHRLAASSILVLLTGCVLLTAQNVVLTGGLSGRVTDPSGAVVPRASVVVSNLQTSVKQSVETNRAGLYRFPVLSPGSYSVVASLKGFRDAQGLVQVLVGNTTSLDIMLQVGASGDAV